MPYKCDRECFNKNEVGWCKDEWCRNPVPTLPYGAVYKHTETNIEIDACRAAVNKYGADSQVKKAIEELAELQVELCHYLCGRGELGAISEEMADVKIMLEQLLIIFGNDFFVAEWEKVKAARLMERINADNKNND